MQLVIETAIFSRQAERLFTRDEREEIAAEVARGPEKWPIERGTGGLRKARIGKSGRGKSGGARVMFLHFDETAPIYLLLAYGKGDQAAMTQQQRKEASVLVAAIKSKWKARKR